LAQEPRWLLSPRPEASVPPPRGGGRAADMADFPVPLQSLPRTTYRCRRECEGPQACLHIAESQSGETGWRVWRASRFLCRFLERAAAGPTPPFREGSAVLELGAGCGLVGIVCAHLGARVTITDLDIVLPLTSYNVQQNALPPECRGHAQVKQLRWGSDVRSAFPPGSFDLIVGSDLTWAIQWDGPLLLATLLQLVSEHTLIVVSLTLRPTQIQGWHDLFDHYFTITVLATDSDPELLQDPGDESACSAGTQSTACQSDDEYTLKYFDDSGDEGRAMNVLQLKPVLPLPPEDVIRELIRNTSSAKPAASRPVNDSD